MPKDNSTHAMQMRERIAQQAARLMAEDGMQDFGQAKRKAADQLGAPGTRNLPTNAEIEQALRVFRELFQKDEHGAILRALREQALAAMRLLAPFRPYLTGAVLAGTAGRHSDIELNLYTDDPKEVELFLLGRGIAYRAGERRSALNDPGRAIPTYCIEGDGPTVSIAVLTRNDERIAVKAPPGSVLPGRIGIEALEALLEVRPGP